MNLVIKYSKSGEKFSDHDAEMLLKKFCIERQDSNTYQINTSTENIILAARALIKEKFFTNGKISFEFEDEILIPNEEGRLDIWPSGFCDYFDNWLRRII